MFVYKPPAALIIFGNMAVLFFGAGFLLVNVLEILPPGNRAGGVMTALWALAVRGESHTTTRADLFSLSTRSTSTTDC